MSLHMETVAVKISNTFNLLLFRNGSIGELKNPDYLRRTGIKYYSSDLSSSLPPQKPTNCKTLNEICGDRMTPEGKQKYKPGRCAPSQRTSCYPIRPKCGEVREIKMKETIVEALPLIVEKIDYKKVTCPLPKFEKPSACPTPPGSNNSADDSSTEIGDPVFPELPKPPCGPVVLCHCPPPPKLHPGDCPCASSTPDTQSAHPTEPCSKFKYSCPEKRIFYCPPRGPVITRRPIASQN